MRSSVVTMLTMFWAARLCAAPTLADQLHSAGIPETSFTRSELSEAVNASCAHLNRLTYLAYMRVGVDQSLTGSPQLVRYDAKTGKVTRSQLREEDKECCGVPLDIDFTRNYVLVSFHDNPSANTVLVVDHRLRAIETLFGFDFHQVAPDEVVFIENMIHFAPAHPERLSLVDLRSGAAKEIYPIKDDPLRAEFARLHKQQMPPPTSCRETDDPCDPDLFDESIQFLHADQSGQLKFRVLRNASHSLLKDQQTVTVASQSAAYVYERHDNGWRYCEFKVPADAHQTGTCKPSSLVVADQDKGLASPFPVIVRKEK